MSQPITQTPPDFDRTRVIKRADGFFWIDRYEGLDYGPFDTLLEAAFDMELADASRVALSEPGRPRLKQR